MSSKHFSNDATALVAAALRSTTYTNPSLTYTPSQKIISLRTAATQKTVALISGGGSGHEPSFAGLVGEGFLTAAVAGSVFASPSAEQVVQAIQLVGAEQPDRGILVIIMNYTGDVLHFGMAVERARAEGLRAELLVVGDDVGVGRKRGGRIGRRGLAGTVLVQKIAAAAAASGATLEEISTLATLAASNTATVGASLSHVHVPGRSTEPDTLQSSIEIGMGIHNEEGFSRVEATLPSLISTMLAQLLDQSDKDRAYISVQPKDEVIVLVNNLGGISPLELGAITAEVVDQLVGTYKITPCRLLSGTYMTSLNGLGFSISLLKVVDKRFVEGIDAPADAAGWSPAVKPKNWDRAIDTSKEEVHETDSVKKTDDAPPSNLKVDASTATKKLTTALQSLIAAEPEVTKYDTIVGDGDCGLCLKTGAEAVLKHLDSNPAPTDAVRLVRDIAHVVETSMDGTSGALYAIFINALASGLQCVSSAGSGVREATPEVWAAGLEAALVTLSKYTPAQPGDRTVVDALSPFVATLSKTGNLESAVSAATKGCDSTKGMEASLGRSVYVNSEGWGACPDPGAYGLVKLLEGLLQ